VFFILILLISKSQPAYRQAGFQAPNKSQLSIYKLSVFINQTSYLFIAN